MDIWCLIFSQSLMALASPKWHLFSDTCTVAWATSRSCQISCVDKISIPEKNIQPSNNTLDDWMYRVVHIAAFRVRAHRQTDQIDECTLSTGCGQLTDVKSHWPTRRGCLRTGEQWALCSRSWVIWETNGKVERLEYGTGDRRNLKTFKKLTFL